MEKRKELECEYCGVPIKETDYKCPNCGANCSSIIKKYKEQQEQEENAKAKEDFEKNKNNGKDIAKAIGIPMIIIGALILLFVILSIAFIGKQIQTIEKTRQTPIKEEETTSNIEVAYKETATTNKYSIVLDDYEFYEFKSDTFPEVYKTKEGYQKIAFHFILENLSKYDITTSFTADVTLRADDYKVEETKLKTGTFEYAVAGQSSYPEYRYNTLKSGERLQGYIGYLVPKDKKNLRFTVGDNIVITMENPAYEE